MTITFERIFLDLNKQEYLVKGKPFTFEPGIYDHQLNSVDDYPDWIRENFQKIVENSQGAAGYIEPRRPLTVRQNRVSFVLDQGHQITFHTGGQLTFDHPDNLDLLIRVSKV